ncbi:uncharacterized acetyltransferase At3g50280-like [Asparagus officinalis]|uniref:uncharacterized acetyltransferase At3g50280-like n=1 Tax=Asparagus officinalis TaxID=4686 RepID=UPI00098E396E|nr:uncharacterized acetyltransferase At3g50280-like [Asparagus officinalis]
MGSYLSIRRITSDGMLFPKPTIPLEIIISRLKTSLSRCLNLFFPVAGCLSTFYHDTMPPSLSILLDCNDQGLDVIVASAKEVTLSDIIILNVPSSLKSFFPLNDANSRDGHSIPHFSIQVTEILDGIFISHSYNHSIADATSSWHFTNSWSEISRTVSVSTISELKEKANTEMGTNCLYSHKPLLVHVWKCVFRAWKLQNDQE